MGWHQTLWVLNRGCIAWGRVVLLCIAEIPAQIRTRACDVLYQRLARIFPATVYGVKPQLKKCIYVLNQWGCVWFEVQIHVLGGYGTSSLGRSIFLAEISSAKNLKFKKMWWLCTSPTVGKSSLWRTHVCFEKPISAEIPHRVTNSVCKPGPWLTERDHNHFHGPEQPEHCVLQWVTKDFGREAESNILGQETSKPIISAPLWDWLKMRYTNNTKKNVFNMDRQVWKDICGNGEICHPLLLLWCMISAVTLYSE